MARLVELFYDQMERRPEAQRIAAMHPDLKEARDKLTTFLVGWLGGPKDYAKRWGPIRIPPAHAHLPIGKPEHEQWLACMDAAIASMPVSPRFRTYFQAQIRVPASRVLAACRRRAAAEHADTSSDA